MMVMPTEGIDAVRDSTAKLIGLEGLRFTAALAVVVWHYHHFYYVGTGVSGYSAENQPFHGVLALFYAYGEYGVHLFWCLSGFIFAWKYTDAIGSGRMPFRRFAALRFSRLYPLHFVTLLAAAALQVAYFGNHGTFFVFPANDVQHFLLGLGFASYWGLQDGMSFNGPSWSVSAEILVYLFFFAQCRVIGGRFSLLAGPIVFLAATVSIPLVSPGFAVPAALAYFYLGVLTSQSYTLIAARNGTLRAALNGAVLLAAAVALAQLWAGRLNFLLFPALILLFQLFIPDRHAALNRCLAGLGDLTYASYMLHFPLQLAAILLIERMGLDKTELFGARGFFLLYIVSVFALARIVFLRLERPAQTMLRRWLLSPSAASRQRGAIPTPS